MIDHRISEAIVQVVNEGTFTREALAKMTQIIDDSKRIENELSVAKNDLDRVRKENDSLNSKLAELRLKEEVLTKRESAVANRETKMTELEKEKAVAEARCFSVQETVRMFLQNRMIRESVTSRVPLVNQSGSGGGSYVTDHDENRNTIREET